MSTMLIVAIVLILGALLALAAGLGLVTVPDRSLRNRVHDVVAPPKPKSKSQTKSKTRNGESATPNFLNKLTSAAMLARIERNMVLAGRPDGWSRQRVIFAKPLGAAIGLLFAMVIVTKTDSAFLTLFALGAIVFGYFVPDLLIYNAAVKRQEQIQKDLPDTLDQIVIGIEAGTGFEAALARAGDTGTGPLADEIVRLLQDLSVGLSRREAYTEMAERTSVVELKNFAKSIVQAEEYGVSVSSVVRTQAKEMRIGRRSRAEAKAQQVPVKILLPLMLLILPVLFIIVLGPPVTNAFRIN